jgi:hypothetical protein
MEDSDRQSNGEASNSCLRVVSFHPDPPFLLFNLEGLKT